MNVDSSSICPSCHRLGRFASWPALRHRAPSAIVWADFASSGIIIRLPPLATIRQFVCTPHDTICRMVWPPSRAPPSTIYCRFFWPPLRAPLAIINIVNYFGPRNIMLIMLAPIAHMPLATICRRFSWLRHCDVPPSILWHPHCEPLAAIGHRFVPLCHRAYLVFFFTTPLANALVPSFALPPSSPYRSCSSVRLKRAPFQRHPLRRRAVILIFSPPGIIA